MEKQERIYITGHQNPDTDSIASAIAYAHLKQQQGLPAVACRLGKINNETKFLLEKFHFEEPLYLEDGRVTLGEIEMDEPIGIAPSTTIYQALEMMRQNGRKTFGVVNKKGQLLGMVTRSDFATIGLADTALSIQLLKKTPLQSIAETLNGKLILPQEQLHFNGKVSIIAIAETKLSNYELKDRLVILGNSKQAQAEAIKMGAGILIVVWSKKIDPEVIELAKLHHCAIIISGHGAMNTTRFLYLSIPVKLLMKKKLVSFHIDDYVEDAGKEMMKTRFRTYPVIDDKNSLRGFLARYHILNYKNKKIILVDHNEFSQSVKNIEQCQLVEIIDHHRISDISTATPVFFHNEIIGSTASIIAQMYFDKDVEMPKEIAGLLLGAILSDTLKFNSPTTTEKDRELAKRLAAIAHIEPDELAKELFQAGCNIIGKTFRELALQDVKSFEMSGKKAMIGQVIVSSVQGIADLRRDLLEVMNQIAIEKNLDLFVVAFTSILENGSIFFGCGPLKNIVEKTFPNEEKEKHSLQNGIVSRKNQIVPMLTEQLQNEEL